MDVRRDRLGVNDTTFLHTISTGAASDIVRIIQTEVCKFPTVTSRALNEGLLLACRRGLKLLVNHLIQAGASLECRDEAGNTPLLIAAQKGIVDISETLLAMGADVNAVNFAGDTALILCVREAGSSEMGKMLLSQSNIDIDHQNRSGYTALMRAISALDLGMVKLLIHAGAEAYGKIVNTISGSQWRYLSNVYNQSAVQMAEILRLDGFLSLLQQLKYSNQSLVVAAALRKDLRTLNICLDLSEDVRTDVDSAMMEVLQTFEQRNGEVGPEDVKIVRKLLTSGFSANGNTTLKEHPLSVCIKIGSYELVELFCQNGASVTHDMICQAVRSDRPDMIPLLASYSGVINKVDAAGSIQYAGSALDVAFQLEDLHSVRQLLFHGATLNVESAFFDAVSNARTDSIEFILTECSEEAKTMICDTHKHIIHTAVQSDDVECIEMLINAGADVDFVHNGKTPIMTSVNEAVIRYLIKQGADVNFKTNVTPLINIFSESYMKLIKASFEETKDEKCSDVSLILLKQILILLLEKGANIEGQNSEKRTVLFLAAMKKDAHELVKLLLKRGANINHTDVFGESPLHLAVRSRCVHNAEVLLAHGCCVNVVSKLGYTPLHEAVLYEDVNLIKLLLDYNADTSIENLKGNTCLIDAADSTEDNIQILKLLLSHGADVNYRNKNGVPALLMAAKHGNENCMKLLLDAKADINVKGKIALKERSAISLILNKRSYNEKIIRCARYLLEKSATCDLVRADVLHPLIADGRDSLVQKLITGGVGPMDVTLSRPLRKWSIFTSVSPLTIALTMNKTEMFRYFVDITYLTKTDIKIFSRNKNIMKRVKRRSPDCFLILKELSKEPLQLQVLSFVEVSSALGSKPYRKQRVKAMPLPELLKEKLLFEQSDVELEDSLTRDWNLLDILSDSLADVDQFDDDISSNDEN